MKFFILRHAEDSDTQIGGWSDIELTKHGKNQAHELRDFILAHNQEFQIQKIVSSDLPRAVQTVLPLAHVLKLGVQKNKLFRALNWGALNGMAVRQAKKKYPKMYLSALEPDEQFPGGGESPNQFYKRVVDSWRFIHNNYTKENKNILICTHGQQFNIFSSLLEKKKWDYKNDYRSFYPCVIWEFDTETKKMRPIMPLKEFRENKKTPRRVFKKIKDFFRQLWH